MRKKTLDRILKVTIILAVIGFFILNAFGYNILTKEGFPKTTMLLSGILLFWTFYIAVGWKIPLIKYIVYQKNLNGTWFGTYKSTNFTSSEKFEGNIAVVIRQNFLTLNVKSFTEHYINFSFGEVLNYDSKSETHQLIYLYSQNQKDKANDDIRKGTSELNLQCEIKHEELFGDFWTNHNSKGFLRLKKVTNKHSKSFSEALKF